MSIYSETKGKKNQRISDGQRERAQGKKGINNCQEGNCEWQQ